LNAHRHWTACHKHGGSANLTATTAGWRYDAFDQKRFEMFPSSRGRVAKTANQIKIRDTETGVNFFKYLSRYCDLDLQQYKIYERE
jgi:hypothetical protein